jgi:hypothetical protein
VFGFSDLEDRLNSDMRAEALAEAKSKIDLIRTEAQSALDSGLTSEDYDSVELLLAALNAADRILNDTSHLQGA